MLKKWFIGFTAVATLTVSSAVLADISLGVIAPRGKDKAQQRWAEYGTYLSKEVGEKVSIVPLLPSEVLKQSKEMDFMLVNPTQTVILMTVDKAKQLATLNKKSGSQFGGVIVAKKGSGIRHAADLKGKKVMGLKFRAAAGAYMFQTYHLILKGINPHTDFASFTEGKKQDDLVMKVKNGVIDAAFIRTGILESMAREKKINLDDFVIVDQKSAGSFKQMLTTVLYPEWSLMAMPKADHVVAEKIKNSSIAMNADSTMAKAAKIVGFVKTVDITPMKDVMEELGVYPFD
ncbi:MAG: PhnD/SsuA/transferrin family substrate-binding protein [Gammaproteobacteria bacterium]|nr:PhnD/SsuA/transferrin family substrate-binding protein [Gammaproteobacteria bacterium]